MILTPGKKQKKSQAQSVRKSFVLFLATFLSAKGGKAEVFFLGKREKTSEMSGDLAQ